MLQKRRILDNNIKIAVLKSLLEFHHPVALAANLFCFGIQ